MKPSLRALLAAAAASGLSCQAQPPDPPRPLPRVSRETLEHFRLREDTGVPAVPPIAILGAPRDEPSAPADAPSASSALASGSLLIEDVLVSVEEHFPLILAAMEEIEIASGQEQQARGAFDTRFGTGGRFALDGFYQNENLDLVLEQPTTLWGATFVGGYRLGQGDFPVYEGKRKTNEDGELRFGVSLPLLQGGSIDPRRVELWQARVSQEQAEPIVLQKRLEATRKAAAAYWKWVSAGQKKRIASRLLELAQTREEQVRIAVEEGELARINIVDNRRLIVEREAALVRAERALQQASIFLSLYLRDPAGQPVVASEERLPPEFPAPRSPELTLVPDAIEIALVRRPEVRSLELELQRLELDLSLARNQMLPDLDVGVYASQDLGGAVNTPDDKSPFELEALLRFSVPLQQRKPRGKRREVEAKMAKLEREVQYVKDLVVTDVRDSISALTQSWQRLDQARENVELAAELEEAERVQLRAGQSDLFRVNVREQQTAVASSSLVDVLSEHFRALADYRAVLGIPYDEVRAGEAVGGGLLP